MYCQDVSVNPEKRKTVHAAIKKEWDIVRGLECVHLVKCYGVEFQQSKFFVFMEFCPRGSLWSSVDDNPLYPELIRKYTAQVWKHE